jgi:hypothetical protein
LNALSELNTTRPTYSVVVGPAGPDGPGPSSGDVTRTMIAPYRGKVVAKREEP